jgi:hypothetical protein
VGVGTEEQIALQQQQASKYLGSVVIGLSERVDHLLAQVVLLGVRAGGESPGSVLSGGLSGDGVLGCSSALLVVLNHHCAYAFVVAGCVEIGSTHAKDVSCEVAAEDAFDDDPSYLGLVAQLLDVPPCHTTTQYHFMFYLFPTTFMRMST